MSYWYAYRTAPRKEFAVEEILKRRGLQVLCPVETKHRRVGRKKVPHDYPMLPRYLFASGADPWDVVRALWGRGITGVVSIAGAPAPIPEDAVHRLARLSGRALPARTTRVHRAFVEGDTAEIVVGPYKGSLVPIEKIKGRVARVLVPMLGATLPAEIALEHLEAA